MGCPNIPPSRLDYMGDFGDDDQRPAKRIRLDQASAGQGGAPPEGHEDGFPEGWGTSQSLHSEWMFPLTTDPLSMSISGSGVGIGPNSNATMPTNSPMTAPMISPVDNSMAQVPWDMHFRKLFKAASVQKTHPLLHLVSICGSVF